MKDSVCVCVCHVSAYMSCVYMFVFQVCYLGLQLSCFYFNKVYNYYSIHKQSGIDMGQFLYLSNEYDGMVDIAELHTVPILVEGEKGVTMEDINKGYHIFSTESPPSGGW